MGIHSWHLAANWLKKNLPFLRWFPATSGCWSQRAVPLPALLLFCKHHKNNSVFPSRMVFCIAQEFQADPGHVRISRGPHPGFWKIRKSYAKEYCSGPLCPWTLEVRSSGDLAETLTPLRYRPCPQLSPVLLRTSTTFEQPKRKGLLVFCIALQLHCYLYKTKTGEFLCQFVTLIQPKPRPKCTTAKFLDVSH